MRDARQNWEGLKVVEVVGAENDTGSGKPTGSSRPSKEKRLTAAQKKRAASILASKQPAKTAKLDPKPKAVTKTGTKTSDRPKRNR